MPEKITVTKWLCKYCNSEYFDKIHAENCESACEIRKKRADTERKRVKELEDKYFPKCGSNTCGKCKKAPIRGWSSFNMCGKCFQKELELFFGEKKLPDEYHVAFVSKLAEVMAASIYVRALEKWGKRS